MSEHFDTVIVGSGFGGSVTAARLSEGGQRVCLLERGQAFPPDSFPRTQHGLSRNFWDPSEGRFGMFNVWSFEGLEALVASGLGGGSLIYANVLLRKPPEWFANDFGGAREPWPVTYDDLVPHYERAEARLGVQRYPFDKAPYDKTRKTQALKDAADRLGLEWELPPLAVTFANDGEEPAIGEPIVEARPNLHGRTRTTCRLCGECDVGCNYGSKNTLDYNYLTDAHHAGADLRTLSEVRRIEPRPEGGYRIHYVRHRIDGAHADAPTRDPESVTADRLVMSAGTLGTTYLLLRSRDDLPNLSPRLGERFCGNGDLLSFAMKCTGDDPSETVDLGPTYGPVITSTIRVPDALDGGGDGRGYYIQDAGFPAFATWLLEAFQIRGTVGRVAHLLWARVRAALGRSPRSDISAELADVLGDCALSQGSLPLLGMGRDVPDGTFTLAEDDHLACDWTIDSSKPYFDRVLGTMRDITDAWGGEFLPNPTYRLSRVITVHPLGGCPMGLTPEEGVVDPFGEVFGYPGLYVADGSVLPGPTGPNPSLTIAALADRTADRILGVL
ncbi:GMC oxidoreductase [Rubrivirga sp. IMCC45206]|uniref:GMC oxidoreductase n=1 Tax=Rubrivirga sp. IMCC45206 TaxID=3391614 RepID=UPI00399023D0